MTNTVNGKQYVGQSVSHRLNHGRYRPFGYLKRFADHISEAKCNNKKNQCSYLNNAIRKYGPDKFEVRLLGKYLREQGNEKEIHFIAKYNTLSPNGYNLTAGGDQRVSTLEQRVNTSLKTQEVAYAGKLERFKNVCIDDPENIEKYVHEYKVYGNIFYCVLIDGLKCTFTGKYQEPKEVKQNAINFIKHILKLQHDQIAGSSLEPQTTTLLTEKAERNPAKVGHKGKNV